MAEEAQKSTEPVLCVVFYCTGLWEVRSHIAQGVARVIFTVDRGVMVLLHAFVKKSQKTPLGDLKTARQRVADLREE
jgi:phage-related protein